MLTEGVVRVIAIMSENINRQNKINGNVKIGNKKQQNSRHD